MENILLAIVGVVVLVVVVVLISVFGWYGLILSGVLFGGVWVSI